MRQAILDSMDPDVSKERHVSILHIFLKAIPEEYSQILWEELRFQLNDVLHNSIIPLLHVISLIDMQEYHIKYSKWVFRA